MSTDRLTNPNVDSSKASGIKCRNAPPIKAPAAKPTSNNNIFCRSLSFIASVNIPVIASGGAGTPDHLFGVLDEDKADAALIASMTHYGEYTIKEIKTYLHNNGIKVRMFW